MEFEIIDIDLINYQRAWDIQREIFSQVKERKISGALIICRHRPVITMGRNGKEENILSDKRQLEKKDIKIYNIERGGDVTYHGPGQLCVYPILNLTYYRKDLNWFLRNLETLLIETLSEFNIKAESKSGDTGVWVGARKIASIGIAVKHWITFHGASLNVKKRDLANFSLIRPCGQDIIMTSMEDVLRKEVKITAVKKTLVRCWYEKGAFARIGRGY